MVPESTQGNGLRSVSPSINGREEAAAIRVAIANDYELVVAGVGALLAPYQQIEIVDLAANRIPRVQADIVLFDTYGHRDLGMNRLHELVASDRNTSVAVYTFEFEPALIDRALSAGVRGYLDKRDSAQRLVVDGFFIAQLDYGVAFCL